MGRILFFLFAFIAAGLTAPVTANAQDQVGKVYWNFYKGSDYLAADPRTQAVYVAAATDSLNVFSRLGFKAEFLRKCAGGREAADMAALLTRWIKNHPEKAEEPAPLLLWIALAEDCGVPPIQSR